MPAAVEWYTLVRTATTVVVVVVVLLSPPRCWHEEINEEDSAAAAATHCNRSVACKTRPRLPYDPGKAWYNSSLDVTSAMVPLSKRIRARMTVSETWSVSKRGRFQGRTHDGTADGNGRDKFGHHGGNVPVRQRGLHERFKGAPCLDCHGRNYKVVMVHLNGENARQRVDTQRAASTINSSSRMVVSRW
jgi:hypothetical protein